jgi:hypothetical protein
MLESFSMISSGVDVPPPAVDFNGKWRNELNSEMNLTVDADGSVTGNYRTGVGTPSPSEEFDLVGFAAGDLLSFSVNFGKYASLTSWSGQLTVVADDEVIKTLWLLARNVEDPAEPDKLWGAVLTGADNFRR